MKAKKQNMSKIPNDYFTIDINRNRWRENLAQWLCFLNIGFVATFLSDL